MRKSIALIVITILLTISFTPMITSSPILNEHKTIEEIFSEQNLLINQNLGSKINNAEPLLSNYFCFVVIIGTWYKFNFLTLLIYGILYSNRERFPILYEKFHDVAWRYFEIMNKIPIKFSYRDLYCYGAGKILTIGLNGICKYEYDPPVWWVRDNLLLIGFKGIWIRKYDDYGYSVDFAVGFAKYILVTPN